jgi:hypothetical protein
LRGMFVSPHTLGFPIGSISDSQLLGRRLRLIRTRAQQARYRDSGNRQSMKFVMTFDEVHGGKPPVSLEANSAPN